MWKKIKLALQSTMSKREPGKWDINFEQWIKNAVDRGVDPNDVGDEAWSNDSLAVALKDDLYLRYVPAGGTVLELGPGTGRLTRHLLGRASKLELVDNSKFVIDYITKYLAGRIDFRTHLIDKPVFPKVPDNSVDAVLAHGVFEHLDFDQSYWFLHEFGRVLKPGGHVSYNYDTVHNEAGREWFMKHRRAPGKPCIFRFYTPDFMQRIAHIAGFEIAQSVTPDARLNHMVLRKPTG